VRSWTALGGPTATIVTAIAMAAVTVAASAPAAAEPTMLLASRWPTVPAGRGLSLEDQITDHLTQLGNDLGRHLDLLSHDMFQLRVDGRRRQAHVRIGGGNDELIALRLDGDLQFDDANCHVRARVDLALHGHAVSLELPAFEMSPVSYRGRDGVELRLPLFVQRF
jgi:hypothetical protein